MKKIIALFLLVASSITYAATDHRVYDAHDIHSIFIKSGSGNIKIGASQDEKIHIALLKRQFDDNCKLLIEKANKVLIIKSTNKSWLKSSNCEVDFGLKIPKAINLDLKSGSGDLSIADIKGKLKFSLGSGDVTINADISNIDGQTDSGSIYIKGLTGDANLQSGSGDINLVYHSLPDAGKINIKTASGDAELCLPSQSKVLTDLRTSNGHISNAFKDSKHPDFKISIQSGSGSVTLKKSTA